MLKFARDLGSPYVISETGTFDEESDWVYNEKKGTEEAYEAIYLLKIKRLELLLPNIPKLAGVFHTNENAWLNGFCLFHQNCSESL